MIFLLIRFLPYIIPLIYLFSTRAVFYFNEDWIWLMLLPVICVSLWFALLKRRNKEKALLLLFLYAIVYSLAGFTYATVLENSWAINGFLAVWSFVYWLYLEAIFHDFYSTDKKYILSLKNITSYANILIIFFLTAALISFNIFLNWPGYAVLLILFGAYFLMSYLALAKNGLKPFEAQTFAMVLAVIMSQVVGAMMLWPNSFYVIAFMAAIIYYIIYNLSLSWFNKALSRGLVAKYLLFGGLVIIIVLASARWF